jgi:hypothetical protein
MYIYMCINIGRTVRTGYIDCDNDVGDLWNSERDMRAIERRTEQTGECLCIYCK